MLAPIVGHFWAVEWDLPRGRTPVQDVLSHPCVHLSLEPDGAWVNGVVTHRFSRELSGAGRVVGVHFRPAGFAAFTDADISTLTDRIVPAVEVLTGAGSFPSVLSDAPLDVVLDELERWLQRRPPAPPADAAVVDEAVRLVTADRDLTRVEQLAERLAVSPRTLQRRFSRYLGVHPKWVIQRARIHDALKQMDGGGDVDWADLALRAGFADQSHFVNAFTSLVGVPPTQYRNRPSVRTPR